MSGGVNVATAHDRTGAASALATATIASFPLHQPVLICRELQPQLGGWVRIEVMCQQQPVSVDAGGLFALSSARRTFLPPMSLPTCGGRGVVSASLAETLLLL